MANSTKKHINLVGSGSATVASKPKRRKIASKSRSKKGGKVGYIKARGAARSAK